MRSSVLSMLFKDTVIPAGIVRQRLATTDLDLSLQYGKPGFLKQGFDAEGKANIDMCYSCAYQRVGGSVLQGFI